MDQVEEGLLTQDQARTHRMSNVITKAIGLDPHMEIADRDVSERSLENGDMVLLCTDGLHPQFENDDDIKKILLDNSPGDACEKLVVEANAKGGPDNITVIVANISPDSPKAAAKEVGKPDTEIITGFVNLIKKALNKLIR
jgi:protein phosphatase